MGILEKRAIDVLCMTVSYPLFYLFRLRCKQGRVWRRRGWPMDMDGVMAKRRILPTA
jgi:hypothetical protein